MRECDFARLAFVTVRCGAATGLPMAASFAPSMVCGWLIDVTNAGSNYVGRIFAIWRVHAVGVSSTSSSADMIQKLG